MAPRRTCECGTCMTCKSRVRMQRSRDRRREERLEAAARSEKSEAADR